MNLFPQLWGQPCLEEESYTCLASSPMVSEVVLMNLLLFHWTVLEQLTGNIFDFSTSYCECGWKDGTL